MPRHRSRAALLAALALPLARGAAGDVPIFAAGEGGYSCIRIPGLMELQSGVLLAFGEARMHSCSDYTWTDVVMKRSTDGGGSWSPLQVVATNSTPDSPPQTVGNAAPVQLRESGRVLMPFCRNNSDVFQTHSDDDGLTWAPPSHIPGVVDPSWGKPGVTWVGLGPPASIQLRRGPHAGRVVVPAYHSPGNDNGLISDGYTMLSDDGGATWRLGAKSFGDAKERGLHPNECQAAELANGSVIINARSIKDPVTRPQRLQTISDDGGESFGPLRVLNGVYEPVEGIEGSLAINASSNRLLYAGAMGLTREKLTLWESTDGGGTWSVVQVIDPGSAGYCSMVVLNNGSAAIHWEIYGLPPAGGHTVFRVLA